MPAVTVSLPLDLLAEIEARLPTPDPAASPAKKRARLTPAEAAEATEILRRRGLVAADAYVSTRRVPGPAPAPRRSRSAIFEALLRAGLAATSTPATISPPERKRSKR